MARRARLLFVALAAALCGVIPAGHARGAVGVIGEHGPFGGIVQSVAIDPGKPDVMYAGTRAGLFTTSDGGAHWRRISDGLVGEWISSVAVDPTDGRVVWVHDGEHLHKSVDRGAHWTDVTPGVDNWDGRISIAPSHPDTIWSGAARTSDGGVHWVGTRSDQSDGVVIDPAHAGTVLITTINGLFRTTDGGASWSPTGAGLPVWSAIFDDAGNGSVVFGIDGYGGVIYRSTDGGASFSQVTVAHDWQVTGLYAAPSDPLVVYAAGRDGRDDPLLALSTDGGLSWAPLASGPVGAILAPVAAVDPADAQHVLVGTFGYGLWVTADGGSSWTARSNGLAATEPRSIATDPLDGSVVYSADASTLAVSEDSGRTWSDATTGLYDPADPAAGVAPLSVTVDGASTAYASRVAESTPAQWDPVMHSIDHGATWQPASVGIPPGLAACQLLADPRRQGVVFASVGSSCWGGVGDVYVTTDSGESWHPVGPAGRDPSAMAFDPVNRMLVIAAVRKVWTTADNGRHWKARASVPLGYADAVAIGSTPDTLYVADNSSSRIAYSRNGGRSWTVSVLDRTGHASGVLALAVDPGDAQTVWAGTDAGGLYVSRDAGVSWAQVNSAVEGRTVAALATTDDTGLATDRVHPLFFARSGGHSNGVARLIPKPRNLRRPAIHGSVTAGSTVTCTRGSWRNAVAFAVHWYRDGARLTTQGSTRLVRWTDGGHHLSCAVRASGPGGHRTMRSRARLLG